MKNYLLGFLVGFWLCGYGALAQGVRDNTQKAADPDIPSASISHLHDTPADIGPKGRITMHEVRVRRAAPLVWDDPVLLTGAADLGWTRLKMEDIELGTVNLYSIAGSLDMIFEGLYPWRFDGTLKAGLFSDLKEIDGDDTRIRGGVRAAYPLRPDVSVSAGAMYNEVFGDDQWYPVVGVTWVPAPEWEIRVRYPDPRVTYMPNNKWLAYLEAAPSGENWTLSYEDQEYGVRMESMRYGGGVECTVSGKLKVRVLGGLNTDRRFHVWKSSQTPLDNDAKDSMYVGLALIWR
ncbi:MAG: hypothetical protein BWY59_01944 [Verrucomicrobia bacterium ADurb.Bin345]|nr:MAG: hypothetical protein BWY59_01944 [Verrucomicrobia bacterium ADurb.Bin345]